MGAAAGDGDGVPGAAGFAAGRAGAGSGGKAGPGGRPTLVRSGGNGGSTGGFGTGGFGGAKRCRRSSTASLAASSWRNLMRTPGRRNGPDGVAHASTTSHVPRIAWVVSARRITNGLWLPGERVVRLAMNSVRRSQ